MQISVTVLTKNSGATLFETLRSVQKFPEVVVFDTGSTDDTLEIAGQFPNVVLFSGEFKGFGPTHNEASRCAKHDWILSIDSDEVVTPELALEMERLQLDTTCAYSIPRDNFFNGKKMRTCAGWYPDPVLRLYHRKTTKFSDDAVHEKVLTKGLKVAHLRHPLHHTPYRSLSDFLDKMQKYTTLFALQHQGKKHSSFSKAVLHGVSAFCKSYLFKRGIFGGKEGFIISFYNAQTAYYKYLKLAELNKKI